MMENTFLMADDNAIMNEENAILLVFTPCSYFQLVADAAAFCHYTLLLVACGKLEILRKAWMKRLGEVTPRI